MGMEYMKGYSQGYNPPGGSAGASAKGAHSTKGNPMSVPKKGSAIGSATDFGNTADRMKVHRLQAQQAHKEAQRGC